MAKSKISKAASLMGRKGGKKRAEKLSKDPEKFSEIMRKARAGREAKRASKPDNSLAQTAR